MRPVHRSQLPVPGKANAWQLLGRHPDLVFLSGAGPDRLNSSCQGPPTQGQQPAPANRRSRSSIPLANQSRSLLHRRFRHRQMLKLNGLLFLSGADRDCGCSMAQARRPARTSCQDQRGMPELTLCHQNKNQRDVK